MAAGQLDQLPRLGDDGAAIGAAGDADRAPAAPSTPSAYRPPAVALGDSFFFLDPPTISYPSGTSSPVVQGAGVRYRVSRALAAQP